MTEEAGKLIISANRGGTIAEISAFLSDLENAYIALYSFDQIRLRQRWWRRFPPEFLIELGYPYLPLGHLTSAPLKTEMLAPNARLSLERVRIESPGFWEFAASLNPLQQIREYLNDRHRRRQDREYREESEKKRLELDNELIQRQIEKMDRDAAREWIEIMRDYGYDKEDIDKIIWMRIGNSMSRLGRHQDTRLIDGAE